MSASDALQRVSEAVATIIDESAAVQAITGRTEKNIVRYKPRDRRVPPVLAYLAANAVVRIGTGESYDVTLLLQAEAIGNAGSSLSAPAQANALLRAAVKSLSVQAFDALGVDAVVMEQEYSNSSDDGADPSTNPAAVTAEAELTVWITLPS